MTEFQSAGKLDDFHRQQLSAMMDGALSPDQARFLLRRLQHDTELAGCWERWQVSGDVLRGHARAVLPPDFSQRVAKAIAGEGALSVAAATTAGKPRWARWGGGAALAASVAVATLFVARQAPQAADPAATDTTQIIAAGTSAPATSSARQTLPELPAADPVPTDVAAPVVAAVAVVQASRRNNANGARRAARPQTARITARAVSQELELPATVEAGVAPPIDLATAPSSDPFGTQPVAASRPWPRALLPTGASAVGGMTVDYGTSASSFHPFAPRVAEPAEPTESKSEDAAPH